MPHLSSLILAFGKEEGIQVHPGLFLRTSLIYTDVRQAVPAMGKRHNGILLLVCGVLALVRKWEILHNGHRFWEGRTPSL